MSLAVIEINDQHLLIQTDQGLLYGEPGFAHLTKTGITTGDTAKASAWQQPQHSYNQYWRQLNQQPLPSSQQWARHHADIAFAQFKQLLDAGGSPETIIIAVPGTVSDEQLSLLLGLASAIPVQVKAVIDSALAICAQHTESTLLVDMQLHQTQVSLIDCSAGISSLSQQETLPDIGIMQLYNAVARHISDRLVANYRYDPLHSSETEQALYDQLPDWLMQLAQQDNLSINLPSPQGDLKLLLQRHTIAEIVAQRLGGLIALIQKHQDATLCFSHGARLVPMFLSLFTDAPISPESIGLENCHRLQQTLSDQPLQRIQQIQLSKTPVTSSTKTSRRATHVLYDNKAYPLHQPLSIKWENKRLRLANKHNTEAALVIAMENQQLKILHQHQDLEIKLPQHCEPGTQLKIADHCLSFIEVSDA
jgi:hypothetical protein